MDSTGTVDHELWQSRLSRFGRVLAIVSLVYLVLTVAYSIQLHQPLFENAKLVPPIVATGAFATLWLVLRGDDDLITGINVTPLVDITLVLLVVMMITASYIASKTIPMELPRSATGETTPVVLAVSITSGGQLYLDAVPTDEAGLRRGIIAARAAHHEPQAIIAADGRTPHVVHVIDVLRQEQVTKFAINVEPEGRR